MSAERILVRGVNWLGDAVMSTPALLRLREARPGAHLTLLTPAKLADLWRDHPAVDAVVAIGPGEGVWRVAARLRAGRFDLGLVLPNSPRSALELWLGGVPRRIGYAGALRNVFLTDPVPPRTGAVRMRKRRVSEVRRLCALAQPVAGRVCVGEAPSATRGGSDADGLRGFGAAAHHIYQYLHLVGALGASPAPLAPRLRVPEDEAGAVGRKFGLVATAADARPLFGLNPGAEYGPAKRWPSERFAAAARELTHRTGCRWVIFGGPRDTDLCAAIAQALSEASRRAAAHASAPAPAETSPLVVNLAGRTTLRELCAALQWCRVLLTNDTGPMHVAAALGVPVVVPFGSTAPELTGPGLPGDAQHQLIRGQAPCAPCFRRDCPIDFRCMTSISVERVVAAVIQASGLKGL